jgi:hypothetical protein
MNGIYLQFSHSIKQHLISMDLPVISTKAQKGMVIGSKLKVIFFFLKITISNEKNS